ncbi:MAG: formylglycine-generating enzyme family protein [Thiothrix sp.]|nr:MAG: formylglycine-generating enzyme family protein [Thiothrix sp.]
MSPEFQSYCLPTETEWDYAARAGATTAYPWGEALGVNQANCLNDYCKDEFAFTAPVASFAPNVFGLHDMQGNVWEWTQDCLASYKEPSGVMARLYRYLPNCQNWEQPDLNGLYVIRGGAWSDVRLLSSSRGGYTKDRRMTDVGFRVAQ